MTQDERWKVRYNEVMKFMNKNHRNPSRHFYAERNMHSWVRHNRKLLNAGTLNPDRIDQFKKLLALGDMYKHKNQYK